MKADTHKDWRERNPIYVWRKERNMARIGLALKLGCSWEGIRRWEMGYSLPMNRRNKVPFLTKLADLMEMSELEMIRVLKRWQEEQHGVENGQSKGVSGSAGKGTRLKRRVVRSRTVSKAR